MRKIIVSTPNSDMFMFNDKKKIKKIRIYSRQFYFSRFLLLVFREQENSETIFSDGPSLVAAVSPAASCNGGTLIGLAAFFNAKTWLMHGTGAGARSGVFGGRGFPDPTGVRRTRERRINS